MELYLFRHGEKEKDGYFIGHTDVELTAVGLHQNKMITQKLHQLHVEQIFTSDLKRTFIAIAGAVKKRDLCEIHFGVWEELSWEEIEKIYPKEARKYLTDPLRFCFPQGESYKEVEKRVVSFLTWLRKVQLKRVGIVTHQGVIRTIVQYIRGDGFWDIHVGSGKGIQITLSEL